jgi:hypothetical protein
VLAVLVAAAVVSAGLVVQEPQTKDLLVEIVTGLVVVLAVLVALTEETVELEFQAILLELQLFTLVVEAVLLVIPVKLQDQVVLVLAEMALTHLQQETV